MELSYRGGDVNFYGGAMSPNDAMLLRKQIHYFFFLYVLLSFSNIFLFSEWNISYYSQHFIVSLFVAFNYSLNNGLFGKVPKSRVHSGKIEHSLQRRRQDTTFRLIISS